MLPNQSRAISLSRSARRGSAERRRNNESLKPEWARALFDLARCTSVGPTPARVLKALHARGLVDEASRVTRAGYLRLMAMRLDPIADLSDEDVAAHYKALRDAPAWPVVKP